MIYSVSLTTGFSKILIIFPRSVTSPYVKAPLFVMISPSTSVIKPRLIIGSDLDDFPRNVPF